MELDIVGRSIDFYKKHKKYVILFGIYLLCFFISAIHDPWNLYYSYEIGGQTYNEVYSPEEDFYYFYIIDFAPKWMPREGTFATAVMRLITFGFGDLNNLFSAIPRHSRMNEVLKIVFPTMMLVKAVVMKRFFAKEKDKVTLDEKKVTLLYYRSESILAEFAADNIAFFLIGVLTKGIYALIRPMEGLTGSAVGNLFDFLYILLLIPCFIPYVSTEWLMGIYEWILQFKTWILYYFAGESQLLITLIFFFVHPIINFMLMCCFEIMLKLGARLMTLIGDGLVRLFRYIMKIIKTFDKITIDD